MKIVLDVVFNHTGNWGEENIFPMFTKEGDLNTADCMKSGAIYGNAAMIDGMIDRFNEEYGEPLPVIATGGYSHAIIKHCKHKIELDDNLVLRGLYIIYKKNS